MHVSSARRPHTAYSSMVAFGLREARHWRVCSKMTRSRQPRDGCMKGAKNQARGKARWCAATWDAKNIRMYTVYAGVLDEDTAATCMANPGWEMQHLFILQENGWSGGASDVTMASYAEKARRLSILHKLSGGTGPGGTSDGPFGNGGVFGDQGFERKRSLGSPNVEKRACYKCGGAY